MIRISKHAHKIAIYVPNLFNFEVLYSIFKNGRGSETYYSKKMLFNLMEESGLKNIKTYNFPIVFPYIISTELQKRLSPFEKYLSSLGFLFLGIGEVNKITNPTESSLQ